MMDILISHGARLDERTRKGQTPLLQAAFAGQESATYLLDHGADVNAKDLEGFTPLFMAAQGGHVPLVDLPWDLLLLRGADPYVALTTLQSQPMGLVKAPRGLQPCTALHHAAQMGILKIVKLLVKRGADIQRQTTI